MMVNQASRISDSGISWILLMKGECKSLSHFLLMQREIMMKNLKGDFMLIWKSDRYKECEIVVCSGCDVEFYAPVKEINRGGGKFCSRNCQRAHQARINSKNSITGITPKQRYENYKNAVDKNILVAHTKVETAILNGTLVRQPCEVCGKERVDAHHDDYSKPLEVRWLCRGHHMEHHRKNNPGWRKTFNPPATNTSLIS